MKKQKEFEKWALAFLNELQSILLLQDYYPLVFEHNKEAKYLQQLFCYPYKSITIQYSEDCYKDWEKEKIELIKKGLTHEMCHVITDTIYAKFMKGFPTKEEIEAERERLTDHFANIICTLRK